MKLSEITFKQFTSLFNQFFDNVEEVRQHESWTSFPRRESYPYNRLATLIKEGTLNESNFQSNWLVAHFLDHYNQSMCGRNYKQYREMYAKIIADPKKLQVIQTITLAYVDAGVYWNYALKQLRQQMALNGKPSFFIFFSLYQDTKASFRHWWDTYNKQKMFRVGEMVELRSTASRNHIMRLRSFPSGNTALRSAGYKLASQLKGKVLMILAYDEQFPNHTYSYKKGRGGTRMVTLLPIGSTQKIYVVEQFLKISRDKGIKEARTSKK